MPPWYRGLQGPILRKKGSSNYVSIGLIEKVCVCVCACAQDQP
jgi:hypothetical protein